MPRSGIEARRRIQEAAFELYAERGYDATTTAEIAARAGVTERTYFRHFADKREVLFDGEHELVATMVGAITEAPSGTSPFELVIGAYRAAVPLFVEGRPIAMQRARLIAVTPALRERSHSKSAAVSDAVVSALVARGASEPTARLAAQVGSAAFQRAGAQWYADPSRDLVTLLQSAVDEVRNL